MGKRIHGHYIRKYSDNGSPTLQTWAGMIYRCTKRYNASYVRYGARGITVDERWLDFTNFLADMGERPEGYTLDRIDPDKGYYRDNCRWACRAKQQHNRRVTKLSWEKVAEIKRLYKEGFSQPQIAAQFGIRSSTVSRVINGKRWKPELPVIPPRESEG